MLMVFWVFNLVGEYRVRWTRPQGVPPITVASLSNQGGLFGPIRVPHDHMVYKLTLTKPLPGYNGSWSQLEGEILDEQQDTLMSFGDEVFFEEGYDEGEYYSESKSSVPLDVTFPKKGNYFVKVSVPEGVDAPTAEGSSLTQGLASVGLATSPVRVEAVPRIGSGLPYQVLGWFTFLGMLLSGFIAVGISGFFQSQGDDDDDEAALYNTNGRFSSASAEPSDPKQPRSFGRSWMD
jgi:hypothetical protein